MIGWGSREKKGKKTQRSVYFILGWVPPETSCLVGYLEYFACARKLPSMSWLESTMQRLRSSGSSIWGNLVSTPRLKRKASNTWAAVQDAFFSTKVCFYFPFWVLLWVWVNGYQLFFMGFVWLWLFGFHQYLQGVLWGFYLFIFIYFLNLISVVGFWCFRIHLRGTRWYLQLELP